MPAARGAAIRASGRCGIISRMPNLDDALALLDQTLTRGVEEARIPGAAWGAVVDGRLAHTGATGTIRAGEDRRPDADTVFRIASMTKSFTAATTLLLRDEGRLRLDDPVGDHVPALRAWRPRTADAPPITVRNLLSMASGLATDDPWGDRQQGLPLDAFDELLAAGPHLALPAGVVFEYSNLGYGILGRVITSAAGAEYRDVVRDRLLTPLGMTATAYAEEDVPEERLAHGYARFGEELVREGRDPYGALAAMGGIFTTVRDLGVWVAGFLDAFPARDDPEGPHPLRRSSRREMQQVHRAFNVKVPAHAPDAVPRVKTGGYGFGLETLSDPDLGTIVSHGGGYPGFGSFMAWHPASGLGVIGLGNLRYAPMRGPVTAALRDLVEADLRPRRRPVAIPAVAAARPAVEALLASWDDGAADVLFAMNVDLDLPRAMRLQAVATAVDVVGGPLRADDAARPPVCGTPAELTWWLRGTRGWIRVRILATPETAPTIQTLEVAAVLDPSPRLVRVGASLLEAAGVGPDLPGGVAASSAFDAVAWARTAQAASARFGAMALGRPIAGDGSTTTAWDLATERGGRAELRVVLDAGSGELAEAELRVSKREAPAEGW
jgi:CubicO group peptidase (beta-lactamase class C family)